MPAHDTYLLHVYRSRAINGWQWSARLERLPGAERVRFSDLEALLAHLRTVLGASALSDQATERPEDRPPPATEQRSATDERK